MRKSRYSDEEIAEAVHRAETGTPVVDIVRKLGISEATLYAWKNRIDRLAPHKIAKLRDENAQLTQLVARSLGFR